MDMEKNEERTCESTIEKVASFDENKVIVNGELDHGEGSSEISASSETKIDNKIGADKESGIAVERGDDLPSNSVGSSAVPAPESASSKSTPTKAYGLKKWRRIRRDLSKEVRGSADSAMILKRRLSLAELAKARDDHKHKHDGDGEGEGEVGAEGSVASLESGNIGVAAHAITLPALDPELGLLVTGTGFSIGADSENSDEQSSKSTAATAPRLRHEAIGFGRERNRSRNYGGRGSGHAVQQRGQRGKGGVADTSKKFRGHQVRYEKENSLSSVESDLRSSGAACMRWGSSVSNGRQGERLGNYAGEYSDEAQASEEVRSGYYKENGGVNDLLQEDLDAHPLEKEISNRSENHQSQLDLDPFLEPMVLLQETQEALKNEIQKLGEIGKQAVSHLNDCLFEETGGSNSPSLEPHLIELNQKLESLEHKLEEASETVKAKESKVRELEAILSSTQSLKKEIGSGDPQLLQGNCEEVEYELENLLKKKMEAEVEYLIITRTTQSLKVLAEDHMAFVEGQKFLGEDQKQMMSKLREAESKAITLKMHAEELEASCEHLLAMEEVLKLQSRVFKLSICSFIQLMMLCISLGLFLMHVLAPSSGIVPT